MGRTSGVGVFLSIAGCDLVHKILAALLLIAAALKGHQLATEPVLGDGFLNSRWLLIVTVEFELLLGLWLLTGCWLRPTWAATLACFAFFFGISLYRALSGQASCGCFGRVSVNPWYTAMLDLAIVIALLWWRPKGQGFLSVGRFERLPGRAIVALGGWFLLAVPTAIAMGIYQPPSLSAAGDIVGSDPVVLLKPETWIGKQFPLLAYVDIGDRLKEGEWVTLLYHHDCPKCQEAMKELKMVANQTGGLQLALIEMPPYGETSGDISTSGLFVRGRLQAVKDWFAKTPVLLVLNQGQVVRVGEVSP
jgi:hypothetical protein